MVKFDCDPGLVLFKKRLNTIWEASEIKRKESDRLCIKVVELSMQCCGKLLSDSFEIFVFIIILNFLFSLNLFADFFKFFKCRFFNNNSRKFAKIFVNNKKPE